MTLQVRWKRQSCFQKFVTEMSVYLSVQLRKWAQELTCMTSLLHFMTLIVRGDRLTLHSVWDVWSGRAMKIKRLIISDMLPKAHLTLIFIKWSRRSRKVSHRFSLQRLLPEPVMILTIWLWISCRSKWQLSVMNVSGGKWSFVRISAV